MTNQNHTINQATSRTWKNRNRKGFDHKRKIEVKRSRHDSKLSNNKCAQGNENENKETLDQQMKSKREKLSIDKWLKTTETPLASLPLALKELLNDLTYYTFSRVLLVDLPSDTHKYLMIIRTITKARQISCFV